MPLTPSEEQEMARSFLRCFGEDVATCGRALRFMDEFATGSTDLLGTLQTEALTWQPFIDAGLSIDWWNVELERRYNETDVT